MLKKKPILIYYTVKWMKTLLLRFSSFTLTSSSHCFPILSAFLYSKPFGNNYMHYEITDHFNIFLVEIKMKKENLKSVFWAPEFGCPDQYTALQNGLNMSLYNILQNNIPWVRWRTSFLKRHKNLAKRFALKYQKETWCNLKWLSNMYQI